MDEYGCYEVEWDAPLLPVFTYIVCGQGEARPERKQLARGTSLAWVFQSAKTKTCLGTDFNGPV